MNSVSRFLIIIAILLLFFALVYEASDNGRANEDSIRAELAAKGLPTPAFASTAELKKILNSTL